MKIVIAAASGNIGRRTAEQVVQAGAETILLTRQPEKLADLAARCATVKQISSDDTQGVKLQVRREHLLQHPVDRGESAANR